MYIVKVSIQNTKEPKFYFSLYPLRDKHFKAYNAL